jgi:hypothetical protein
LWSDSHPKQLPILAALKAFGKSLISDRKKPSSPHPKARLVDFSLPLFDHCGE